MKNTLLDLNNYLFEQIERLHDDDLTDDQLGLRSEDPDLTEAGLNLVRLKQAAKDARKRKKK